MTTPTEANPVEAVAVTTTGAGTATAVVNREAVEAAKAQEVQEQGLLAGKFKTPEDLAKAYKELEQKLGQQPQQPAGAPAEPTAEEPTEGEQANQSEGENPYGKVVSDAITAAGIDIEAAQKHFTEKGTLSDADIAAFEKAGFPKAVVDAYLKGVSAPAEEAKTLAQSQVDAIKGSVGGPEGFAQLQQFIAGNFSEAEKAAYNAAVGSGDFEKALGAVNAAKLRYTSEIGTEGTLVGGKTPSANAGFANDAEMKEAMRDPRYKTSEAYRQEVAAKIAASTYFVTR